ncbi:MAG: NAD-dependent epimerase/dehydratase family protein [Planctomycetes bacterium]|nr:NAD-dependent epimerase/dehydratase family protein [Planctomycetota bacterium]
MALPLRKPVTLITGAGGEIGHGLVEHLLEHGDHELLCLDLRPLGPEFEKDGVHGVAGNILDKELWARLVTEYEIRAIYHLAALLSTRAEYSPEQGHRVNVDGTLILLELAVTEARYQARSIPFLFPSSIAAYGLPDRATKERAGRVREIDHNFPTTMYGCNKLYCEHLGRYYSEHFQQLTAERGKSGVDFRSLRFPGLISAKTVPTGGTSDYAPEMLHHAAQGTPYPCFVDEGARLPFMAMPDAIRSLTMLASAPVEALRQRVYNVGSFSFRADDFRARVLAAFPDAQITFEPDTARNGIVATWPADVDDTPAREQWGWKPEYDLDRALDEYLIPEVRARYEDAGDDHPRRRKDDR